MVEDRCGFTWSAFLPFDWLASPQPCHQNSQSEGGLVLFPSSVKLNLSSSSFFSLSLLLHFFILLSHLLPNSRRHLPAFFHTLSSSSFHSSPPFIIVHPHTSLHPLSLPFTSPPSLLFHRFSLHLSPHPSLHFPSLDFHFLSSILPPSLTFHPFIFNSFSLLIFLLLSSLFLPFLSLSLIPSPPSSSLTFLYFLSFTCPSFCPFLPSLSAPSFSFPTLLCMQNHGDQKPKGDIGG